ncbi:MAG TPA: hypothetical protein VGM20_10770 [Gemmatimonadales bacterium]|jgi:hypothetical protein
MPLERVGSKSVRWVSGFLVPNRVEELRQLAESEADQWRGAFGVTATVIGFVACQYFSQAVSRYPFGLLAVIATIPWEKARHNRRARELISRLTTREAENFSGDAIPISAITTDWPHKPRISVSQAMSVIR